MVEEFDEDERRGLDAWQVGDGPDLSERVLAQLEQRPKRPFRLGVGVVALVAVAVIASIVIRRGEVREWSVEAAMRTTVPIAERAVAVMEPGAAIQFRTGPGLREVDQRRGDVFYRVEPGDPFAVRTAAGTVTVVGTCFRVEVPDMNSMVAGAIGSAAGALVAGAVMVTVYEGKVVAESSGGSVAVEAGETAQLAKGRAPVKRLIRKEEVQPEAALEAIDETAMDPAKLPEHIVMLTKQKVALEREVAALREQLEQAKASPHETRMFDIPQEELLQMAQNCEVRWDVPGIGGPPQTLDPEEGDKLELSPGEVEIVDRRMAESQARLLEEVRKAYSAITGEENTGTMAGEAMFAEIVDKTPEGEVKRLFHSLSQERAGLQPRPTDTAAMTPFERMFRAMAGEGDRLEQAIAAEIGPEAARRTRDLHKGWGNRHRNRVGCP